MKKFHFLLFTLLVASYSFGQAWQYQNPLPQGNSIGSIRFVNMNTGYAVCAGNTLMKTTDGGTNWVILDPGITSTLSAVWFTDETIG